ncbi:hypothetical protein HZS_4049 [Henneguya salminicola]|nr:hypothetical protein HZS_4049 [Henneguya salminicola]
MLPLFICFCERISMALPVFYNLWQELLDALINVEIVQQFLLNFRPCFKNRASAHFCMIQPKKR